MDESNHFVQWKKLYIVNQDFWELAQETFYFYFIYERGEILFQSET